MADSPVQVGGRSATVFHFCTRKGVSLVWASKLNGRQSAHGAWTVRRLISDLYQRGCFSGLGSKVKLRTVRSLGADGPQAKLKFVPETMFVSGGLELLTADGPPLGRGRSARA